MGAPAHPRESREAARARCPEGSWLWGWDHLFAPDRRCQNSCTRQLRWDSGGAGSPSEGLCSGQRGTWCLPTPWLGQGALLALGAGRAFSPAAPEGPGCLWEGPPAPCVAAAGAPRPQLGSWRRGRLGLLDPHAPSRPPSRPCVLVQVRVTCHLTRNAATSPVSPASWAPPRGDLSRGRCTSERACVRVCARTPSPRPHQP